MAEIEEVTILRVDTGEAVTSVADLRDNIKALKKSLDQAEIGSKEYRDTLRELQVNQNALKDAMYATSTSMEDLTAAAQGAGQSYNALVHRMAELKSELRATDVSTQAGKKRFAELAQEINNVNQQLKDMDAAQGNFQRNVGNYKSALDGIGSVLKGLPPTLGQTAQELGKVGTTMEIIGKQPIIGLLGIILPLITAIASKLKENETAMTSVQKAGASLEPVFTFFEAILEKIAQALSKVTDWFVKMVSQSSDTFKSIVTGAMGVSNALKEYMLIPVRTTVEAFKGLGNVIKDVFTGQWDKIKSDAKDALDGIGKAFKDGVSFKANYEAGRDAGAAFIEGMGSRKKKAKDTGGEVAKSFFEGVQEELEKDLNASLDAEFAAFDKEMDAYLAQMEKKAEQAQALARAREQLRLEQNEKGLQQNLAFNEALEEDDRKRAANSYALMKRSNEARLGLLDEFREAALGRGDVEAALQYEQQAADLRTEIELNALKERKRLRDIDRKDAEQAANATVSAVQGVLSTIADIYESNDKATQEELRRAKALRIAGATIEMLSGVVAAVSTAMQLGPIAGPIVGAANAAMVVAAGIANIAKIKAQPTDGRSASGGATASVPTPAAVSAPAVNPEPVERVATATGADAEDRLNGKAGDQKVYILQSEMEASDAYAKATVAEASF